MTSGITRPIGDLLREWRERRRLSQLALALDAEVSTRHLSFLETGRARPSREMLLRLTERLEVPLRERNTMLLAAGFAPAYPERDLDDPALGVARAAIDRVLAGHEPFPALAIDRYWTLVAANRVVPALLTGVAPELLQPPINVLRLSLHPDGLAAQIVNLPEWRAHLLARLSRQVELTADPRLSDLLQELGGYARDQARGTPINPFRTKVCIGGGAAASSYRARHAFVPQHDDGLRHAGRRDPLRVGDRSVLPRRCRDRRSAATFRAGRASSTETHDGADDGFSPTGGESHDHVFSNLDPLWMSPIAFAVISLGLVLVCRGLRGGRDGERALLGQRTDMLSRIEGFRLTVFGLVLIGVGAAVFWRAQWLLLLALGIGFVEILESSTLIAVWRWGRRAKGDGVLR